MEKFLDYWRACVQLQQLHIINANHVAEFTQTMPRAACTNGKLSSPSTLTGTIAVAPYYAKKQNQYFIPCLLLVELNANGEFCAQRYLSFPIIPHSVLEPAALCPISMGSAENFNDY
ncbi:MAG TPA: hypothetical protein VLG38_08430, partial [Gammaproteobacteria bacterium]|nr:hypothetical protein [Gammaproteobacteria bacterium]